MSVDLNQNHFEIFGVAAKFEVDLAALENRYRELQREVHPDRFASASQAAQRVSMQLATRVNEAYQTLKSPVARAAYLLHLHGVDPEFETNTAMPAEFLGEQLELREALEEAVTANDVERLGALSTALRKERGRVLERLASQLDAQRAWKEAAATLRQLMFLEKFGEEIGASEEKMEY